MGIVRSRARDGKPIAEGTLMDKPGGAIDKLAGGGGIAAERPIHLPFAQHSRTISRTLLRFFTSLLGRLLRAGLLAALVQAFSSVLEIIENGPDGTNAAPQRARP